MTLANLRARKAALRGMSLEEFDEHVRFEQERIDAVRRARSDREHCLSVIAEYATLAGRELITLDLRTFMK